MHPLARAIHETARSHTSRMQATHMGVVVDIRPLTVELAHSQLILSTDDDDFVVSQWVKFYDQQWRIAVDDVVILHRHSGQYVLVDIVSDTETPGA